MNAARQHNDWLSLVDRSGPFVSLPVLLRVFPQGLDRRDPERVSLLREAYDDWRERGTTSSAVHHGWIRHVLTSMLEYHEKFLLEGQAVPPGLEANVPAYGESIQPDLVLRRPEADTAPLLLINIHAPGQDLEKPMAGRLWKASPATRMAELLHATGVPVGLITNGEQWMLVSARPKETSGYATWHADLWMQEEVTLRAFHSLLHQRRFTGVAEPDTLAMMLADSRKDQQEVTDQLGYQVRKAVEVLVQAFDQLDEESGRALLAGVSEKDLYDSALTVMMRLVFLFSAEERGLLLLGDPLYNQNYAVSTLSGLLRDQADQQGEEVLERRQDAWCRLLATFRAVHGGVEHEALRLPAYGGTLFDPDRYPFLEGRGNGTSWRSAAAQPVRVNNRVVLHLLEALQFLQIKVPGGPSESRRLSFGELGVEQIGHVYEGLLDHIATRASEVFLGLAGSRDREPELTLVSLERARAESVSSLVLLVHEETGRSESAIGRLLGGELLIDEHALQIACGHDEALLDRVRPFANLLRTDNFGRPMLVRSGHVFVTAGSHRRDTGTHYTPPSLTEPIVRYTLEPLVYVGPADGMPPAQWSLKSPRDILALKVADMAMGSGAFLVEVCRYLADRLVEAWENVERAYPSSFIASPDGEVSSGLIADRLLPTEAAERIALARRYIADRCLYGVDINPMAVEMAKLSIWLITSQRDRPFSFLDHALKSGDSLTGLVSIRQVESFSLRTGDTQATFATARLHKLVNEAEQKRSELVGIPSADVANIVAKDRLNRESLEAAARVKALADLLVAFELRDLDGDDYERDRVVEAEQARVLFELPLSSLATSAEASLKGRRTFHWPLEFPEVFAVGGFDAIVGNPPFMVAFKMAANLSPEMVAYLKRRWNHRRGRADLSAYFLLRASVLVKSKSMIGLITTKTIAQEDNRRVALDHLVDSGFTIVRATTNLPWPGQAAVYVCVVHIAHGDWAGEFFIANEAVLAISTSLEAQTTVRAEPAALRRFPAEPSKGTTVNGTGFLLTPSEAAAMIAEDGANAGVIRRYLNGAELNDGCDAVGPRFIVDFGDMDLSKAQRFVGPWRHVEANVLPTRKAHRFQVHEKDFWKFSDKRPDLYAELRKLDRAVVFSLVSKYFIFAFAPADQLFSSSLGVVPTSDAAVFGTLQSAVHLAWAREYQYSLEGRPRYSIGQCYRTFPFLDYSETGMTSLRAVSESFHDARVSVMRSFGIGLRELYGRFNDPANSDSEVLRLRQLQMDLDNLVMEAYGWSDVTLDYQFSLSKETMLYSVGETARKSILGRLYELNQARSKEERAHSTERPRPKAKVRPAKKARSPQANFLEPSE